MRKPWLIPAFRTLHCDFRNQISSVFEDLNKGIMDQKILCVDRAVVGTFIGFKLAFFVWVGVLVCGFRAARPEETPPTCRIAVPLGYKSKDLATEQKRNVHLDMAMTHL